MCLESVKVGSRHRAGGSLAAALGWLGVRFDDEANARKATRLTTTEFGVTVLVLPTNEEWMIARHTAAMIG